MPSTAVQNGLQIYLRQINESPLLTADQEKELGRRIINDNDPAAREAAAGPLKTAAENDADNGVRQEATGALRAVQGEERP